MGIQFISTFLNIVEIILCLAIIVLVGLFLFTECKKRNIQVIRLICHFGLIVINIVQIPIDIAMDKSCILSVILVITWIVNFLILYSSLRNNSKL